MTTKDMHMTTELFKTKEEAEKAYLENVKAAQRKIEGKKKP